ncbi:MAG: NnrS family protein [Paludibacterium sp.]|uniref:NnrS family protein n=1 Tax=Paludibacterium sp. TaxID=1917523 RepID=UPI0025F5B753|nr:NnrS family protein [Paludibacterium sp.]MBV8048203.1 NnrS family protein [Paludibacterium sp.]
MALLQIEGMQTEPAGSRWPLWRLGFRPFYWLAAAWAAVIVPVWLGEFSGRLAPLPGLNGLPWHVHEMLYGYTVAVVAGFLLTAVRNWTGRPTPTGWPLAGLTLLWLAGRLLLPVAPLALAAPVDLAFLPCLAWVVRRRLRAANNRRNAFVPRLLLALAALNLAFYLPHAGWLALDPLLPLRTALMLVVTLSVIMAGRLHPLFTRNAVAPIKQYSSDRLERWIAPLTLAVLLADLAPLPAWVLAPANLALAGLHFWRGWGWAPLATWRKPILWILHLSYLALPCALLLAVPAAFGRLPWLVMEHVLGIGVVGGLTLGMMVRSALGHTGRALATGRLETLAFVALMLAVPLRVAYWLLPAAGGYLPWLWTAGSLWTLAFALFVWRFTPILNRARVDGKAG